MKPNITMIGMPSSGKSTVGVLLAKRLGFSFVDVDIVIQEKEGRLLKEIIAGEGMDGFLKVEERVNAGLDVQLSVIAPGGSAIYGREAMEHFKEIGTIVYLKLSYEDLAKRLGADYVINTKEEGFMEKAMALTDGKGYGYVYETAGQVPTMHMAFELAANKAHVCFIGTPHENLTFTPKQWENMNRKEFKLTGSWMSYSAPYPGREWDLTAHYFATGQLKFDPGFIYKKIPMSQAQEAFQLFKTPGLVKGKILLSNEED